MKFCLFHSNAFFAGANLATGSSPQGRVMHLLNSGMKGRRASVGPASSPAILPIRVKRRSGAKIVPLYVY